MEYCHRIFIHSFIIRISTFYAGFDLALYMPPLERFLAAEELKDAGLSENSNFQFLLRAGYEQILRAQDDVEME